MSQTHYMLAGACAVGLAIGYVAGGSRGTPPTSEVKENGRANPRAERGAGRDRGSRGEGSGSDEALSSLLKGRSLQALSSDELSDMIANLSKFDPTLDPVTRARRSYQLQVLFSKLSASQLEDVANTLATDPDNRRTGNLSVVLGAMTVRSPERAMVWANEQANPSSFIGSIIGAMAKDDPVRAADLYREALLTGSMGSSQWEASFGLGTAMARLGKKSLMDFVDGLPRQQQGNVLSNSIRELPEGEREAMADEIFSRFKKGDVDDWSFKSALSALGSTDPAKITAWLEKLPAGDERAKLMMGQAASSYARPRDPKLSESLMSKAIAEMPGREKELLQELSNSVYNSPGDFAVFGKLLPPSVEIKAEDLKRFGLNAHYNGSGGIVDVAKVLRDPAEQAELVATSLENLRKQTEQQSGNPRMNATDFEILKARLRGLNLTGADAQRVAEAFDAARDARPKPKE